MHSVSKANELSPSFLQLHSVGGYEAFNREQCAQRGRDLHQHYVSAQPFPHIVIDDFLSSDILARVLRDFPSSEGRSFYDDEQTRLKYQYRPDEIPSALVRNLFAELTGAAFIAFLEELTGIKGLIADHLFEGGGLHETKSGGRLGVHADYTLHKDLNVERRINLLVYLNDPWPAEYGGDLELWDKAMRQCKVKVQPVFGRAVIFNTTRDSWHGQPEPVTCPPDRSRKSIATYYFTAAPTAAVPDHLTNFQVRPGTDDKPVRGLRREHLIRDWVPPWIQQRLRSR